MITGICLAEIDGQKNDAEITFSLDGKKSNENRAIRYDMHEELKKLLAKYEKGSSENLPMPIVVYYASMRSLNEYDGNKMSESGKKSAFENAFNPQIDFSSSLAWFISKAKEEARETRRRLDELISNVSSEDFDFRRLKEARHTLPELNAVRSAISKALGDYGEPYVDETPPKLFIAPRSRPDQGRRIEQLSGGHRIMLALVMDLARRMAAANEQLVRPKGRTVLHSPGVVLIDEVELHLHPSWRQTVLPSLMEIFPDVQFIVTTHSPLALTSIPARHIRVLKYGQAFTLPDNEETEGADAARLLEDVLGVNPRPLSNNYVRKLNRYAEMVYSEQWDSPEAEELRVMLEKHYRGSEPKLQELALHVENSKWESRRLSGF
jgi:predicted ATP-binding protein involved in virulence